MVNRLVSIIMPVYNSGKYIDESIQSVLSQTYSNWELIIIDDCSCDNSYYSVLRYSENDNRIIALKNSKNLGVAETRNKAIGLAKGEYIALIDSDDIWREDKLEKQVNFMVAHPNVDLCSTSYELVNSDTSIIGEYLVKKGYIKYHDLLKENLIGCSTVMAQASLLKNNKFNSYYSHEDYALWLQILKKDCIVYVMNESLAKYRVILGSRSNNKRHSAYNRWVVLVHSEKINIFISAYYMCIYFYHGVLKYIKSRHILGWKIKKRKNIK